MLPFAERREISHLYPRHLQAQLQRNIIGQSEGTSVRLCLGGETSGLYRTTHGLPVGTLNRGLPWKRFSFDANNNDEATETTTTTT